MDVQVVNDKLLAKSQSAQSANAKTHDVEGRFMGTRREVCVPRAEERTWGKMAK